MLHLVKIPRNIFSSNVSSFSFHVFCDASGISYAAVVFIRCQSVHGTSVQLLAAKSRIAPLKSITIPGLELLACCIGARLLKFVKESLNIVNVNTQFGTDFTTGLQWIRRDEPWSVFVRNRVNEIRKLSNIDDWRHVPGPLNPADLSSRGCSVLKLLSSKW
ncbi:uncharacterized protein LOC129959312 [Argiope bruennichi]|uniref:uncharacterized protein LOC129959312 n=1 Tax=Argiope bruennichi TaxID=94029 RepID=UPI0024949E91|nr:uncharacterized protein LOC129959312 [Argiope bruennichi]